MTYADMGRSVPMSYTVTDAGTSERPHIARSAPAKYDLTEQPWRARSVPADANGIAASKAAVPREAYEGLQPVPADTTSCFRASAQPPSGLVNLTSGRGYPPSLGSAPPSSASDVTHSEAEEALKDVLAASQRTLGQRFVPAPSAHDRQAQATGPVPPSDENAGLWYKC